MLVTRAAEDAPRTVAALEAAGLSTAVVPLIVRRAHLPALRAALLACPRPDVLLLTSAHAAALVAAARPPGFAPACVAVVGPATAEGARAAGIEAHVEPAVPTGVAAVAALGELRGRTVLYVRASEAVAATRDALVASGAHLVEVDAYTTEPAPSAHAQLAQLDPVDVVLLLSPSAARAWVAARAPHQVALPVVALGPTTAAACRALGLHVAAEGAGADLVEAVRRATA